MQAHPPLRAAEAHEAGALDGLQVLVAIRSTPSLLNTRVIMVTARGQVSDYEDGMQRGADAYFIKPFDLGLLVTKIESILK